MAADKKAAIATHRTRKVADVSGQPAQSAMAIAEEAGLLRGARTKIVRGRGWAGDTFSQPFNFLSTRQFVAFTRRFSPTALHDFVESLEIGPSLAVGKKLRYLQGG